MPRGTVDASVTGRLSARDVVAALEGVKAAAAAITAVLSLLEDMNRARSVVIEVDNNTSATLNVTDHKHAHGGFAKAPDISIPPRAADVFGSQSRAWSLWTGTEGHVVYTGQGFTFKIRWSNPFTGDNSASAELAGPRKESFTYLTTAGAGDEKAEMRYQLFERDSPGGTRVGGAGAALFAGGSRLFAVTPPAFDIHEFRGRGRPWIKVGGPGHAFAVDDRGRLYGISEDRRYTLRYDDAPNRWTAIGGEADSLVAGGDKLYRIKPDRSIFRWDGTHWPRVGEPGRDFARNENDLYGVSPDGDRVVAYAGGRWDPIGTDAHAIYARGRQLYMVHRDTGALHRFDSGRWPRVGNPGAAFALSETKVFGLTPRGDAIFEWTGRGEQWRQVGKAAQAIAANATSLFALSHITGEIYELEV